MRQRARQLWLLGALGALGLAWRCVAVVDAGEAGLIVGPGAAVAAVVETPGLVIVWPWQRVVAVPEGGQRLELRGLEVQSGDGLPLRVDVRVQLRFDLAGGAALAADGELRQRARLLSLLAAATQAEVSRVAAWPAAPLAAELPSAADAGAKAANTRRDGLLGLGRRALERAIAARWLAAAGGEGVGAAAVALARLRPSGDAEGVAVSGTIAACRAEATAARGRGERRRLLHEAEAAAEVAAIAQEAEAEAEALLAAAEADALQIGQAARGEAPASYDLWRAALTVERALATGGGALELWLGRHNGAWAPLWPTGPVSAPAGGGSRKPVAGGAPTREGER